MVQQFVRSALLAGAFLVSGCVTRYSDVAETTPHAVLEFGRGYESGNNIMQEYSISAAINDDCGNIDRAALFTVLSDGSAVSRRAPVGTQLKVYDSTEFINPTIVTDNAYVTTIDSCVAQALFTPQEGHSYSVVHHIGEGRSCSLEVVDVSTGSAPHDLSIIADAGCVSGRAVATAPEK